LKKGGAGAYRYGFNGKENDNEVKGEGNQIDFGERMYDSRVGRWLSLDPLQKKYPSFSPYVAFGNSPIIMKDPDGRDIVYFNVHGVEVNRILSKTKFETFVQVRKSNNTVHSNPLTAQGAFGLTKPSYTPVPFVGEFEFVQAPMPKIITDKSGAPTTAPQYQKYDYNIAAETFLFNDKKNSGITPTHTNGKYIDNAGTVPDLDPTLVKATIMQESTMGTHDPKPNDRNNTKSDIMQANVYYSETSNDWGEHKKQFGLTKDGGATPIQSIRAGIGLLYQKGLQTNKGKTTWIGGATWDDASKNYNGGGAANYGNVIKMRDASVKPTPSNYVQQ